MRDLCIKNSNVWGCRFISRNRLYSSVMECTDRCILEVFLLTHDCHILLEKWRAVIG